MILWRQGVPQAPAGQTIVGLLIYLLRWSRLCRHQNESITHLSVCKQRCSSNCWWLEAPLWLLISLSYRAKPWNDAVDDTYVGTQTSSTYRRVTRCKQFYSERPQITGNGVSRFFLLGEEAWFRIIDCKFARACVWYLHTHLST